MAVNLQIDFCFVFRENLIFVERFYVIPICYGNFYLLKKIIVRPWFRNREVPAGIRVLA